MNVKPNVPFLAGKKDICRDVTNYAGVDTLSDSRGSAAQQMVCSASTRLWQRPMSPGDFPALQMLS